jgi:hypothetical protein
MLTLTTLTGRFRHVGREIWVGVEAEPPHLISGLTGFALGSRITDPRLGAPDTSAQHGKQVQAAVTSREIPIEYVNRRILDTIPPP